MVKYIKLFENDTYSSIYHSHKCIFIGFLIYICQLQILAVRQKPEFFRKLVPYTKGAIFLSLAEGTNACLSWLLDPQSACWRQLPNYYKSLFHISESMLTLWLFSLPLS